MPNFYLRIDVAHFMKIYANFLKSEHKSVKTFFLGALGKLVVSRNFSEAKKILKLILIVCRSEHQGKNESGNMSICSLAKENLKKLLVRHENIYKTGNDEVDIVLEKVNDSDGSPTHKKGSNKFVLFNLKDFSVFFFFLIYCHLCYNGFIK